MLPLQYNKDGVTPINERSLYQPSDKVQARTHQVQVDYQQGKLFQTKPLREFDDRSLIEEIDMNQKAFNSYVPPRSTDPADSWRAQTVRPVTRNKLISIAAHITSVILYPSAFAQNDRDEEDREAGHVMRDLMEWTIDNSNYKRAFIQAVISALVDPVVILEAGFYRVMRTVRTKLTEKDDEGNYRYDKKEIIDEILSGFKAYVIPCQQILISNIYEPDIQRQRFVIKDRYIDFNEARQIYGNHKSFEYVIPGTVAVFDDYTRTFYNVQDEESKKYLVKETIYYHRTEDLQLAFVNGIMMCDPDSPITREDKLYPFAKTGYEPLNNGQFFYYKSAANKLGSDQEIVDALYNFIIDGNFMALMPPMAIFGSEEADSGVMIPGSMTAFRDPNVKMESLAPRMDLRGGLEAMALVEKSMSESSQDNARAGVGGGSGQTAREVMLLEKNAQVQLGLFKHMIGFLIEDFGTLLMGDILQYMTIPQIEKLTDGVSYRSFLLPNKIMDGKTVTKKIEFTADYLGKEEMSQDEILDESWKILEREGGPEGDKKIMRVNPASFRTLKYRIKVGVDELSPKSKELEKALDLEAYDRLIANPLADQEAVLKDFLLDAYRPGDSDKYVKKQQPMAPQMGPDGQPLIPGEMPRTSGVNTSMLSQITGSNSLGASLGQ
jgi:hypothetical protein